MDFRIFTEPQQGATYEQLLSVATCAEEEGFDAFFRSDHYLAMGSASGLPGPTDAWITLAGLARDTSTIRLGTLVTSATFRLPGPLAISVAQVDAMSGGRVELGLGAGWFEQEHDAYGIAFPSLGERFERLEEQLEMVTGLWDHEGDEPYAFAGKHYTVVNSPALPKPVQRPRPPVIVGGGGPTRTPRLAATYASEFNTPFLQPSDAGKQFERVRAACELRDRDPASMTFSSAVMVCCGENDAEVARRAAAIGWSVDDAKTYGAAGSAAEVAERIRQWRDVGAGRIYLQILDLSDLDHLRLLAQEVVPQVVS